MGVGFFPDARSCRSFSTRRRRSLRGAARGRELDRRRGRRRVGRFDRLAAGSISTSRPVHTRAESDAVSSKMRSADASSPSTRNAAASMAERLEGPAKRFRRSSRRAARRAQDTLRYWASRFADRTVARRAAPLRRLTRGVARARWSAMSAWRLLSKSNGRARSRRIDELLQGRLALRRSSTSTSRS